MPSRVDQGLAPGLPGLLDGPGLSQTTSLWNAFVGLSGNAASATDPGVAFVTGTTMLGDISVTNTATSGVAVPMPTDGWLLRIATNLGTITSCDATKLTMTVTDFGWNTDGSQHAGRSRTVLGSARLTKTYPDGAVFTDADQATGVVEVALEQQLYNDPSTDSTGRVYKTAITGISFAAGFINGSSAAGSLSAGQLAAIVRSDSKAYPLPIYMHMEHPEQILDTATSTFSIGFFGIHEWAQQGQQFACIEAYGRSGTTDGTVVRAGTATECIYTSDRAAPSGFTGNEYRTTVSFVGLADGDVSIRSTCKPWIGPLCNSIDSGIGDTWPSPNLLADFPLLKDTTNAKYGRLVAYVNNSLTGGLAGTSTAGITPWLTGTLPSDPGLTLSYNGFYQAAQAAALYNNTIRASGNRYNSCDGLVIVCRDDATSVFGMDIGAYCIDISFATAGVIKPEKTFVEFRSVGGVPTNAVRLRGNTSAGTTPTGSRFVPTRSVFRGIKFDASGTASTGLGAQVISTSAQGATDLSLSALQYTVFINCEMWPNTNGNANPLMKNQQMTYCNRLLNNGVGFAGAGYSTTGGETIAVGSKFTGAAPLGMTHVFASRSSSGPMVQQTETNAGVKSIKQILLYNSRFDANGSGAINFATGRNRGKALIGLGICGSLFRRFTDLSSANGDFSADAKSVHLKNFVVQHLSQSSGGETYASNSRFNMFYNETGGGRQDKEASIKYSVFPRIATKASYWSSALTASTNNSAYSAAVVYYQGDHVWDSLTGSNTYSTSTIYVALQDMPAATALSNATYWRSLGVRGTSVWGPIPHRSGNKRWRYGVSCLNNVTGGSVQGAASDTTPDSLNSWLGDQRHPSTKYARASAAHSWGGTDGVVGAAGTSNNYYVDDTGTVAATEADVGDFHPNLTTGYLLSQVPAGLAVDTLDLTGRARLNNGTGAAGAYERTA